ncbi:MAG: HEAT repeat domain-containing protein, partial [Bryobacteraceae bacterium]
RRQQHFGGWMDPLQSFENFRTPFRETQMSVLALSSYFPGDRKGKGWNTTPVKLSSNTAELLIELDGIWDRPSDAVLDTLLKLAASSEVLVRQQAIEALGRVAPERYAPLLTKGLGDPSKLVRRTAAWAGRQIYNRDESAPASLVVNALQSRDARVRWGATRMFATHARSLARYPEFADALAACANSSDPAASIQAIKGLWQYWFWSADPKAKSRVEDLLLAAMSAPNHPWIDRNLREAIYNIADENIRYLYNNWIPLLATPEDRSRAIQGRLAVESRLAEKFAGVLEKGNNHQRKMLLAGLTEFPLRRADVYDPKADPTELAPPIYNRIGNDAEQIVFFGQSNDRFARALRPLLDAPDPEMRRLATQASLLVRDITFPGVNAEAGKHGAEQDSITQVLLSRRPETDEVLKAFGRGPAVANVAAASRKNAGSRFAKPDEAYFRGYVQPILETRGKDGYACVHCHATHTLFSGTYSTVMNVVDLNDPENSLLLRKPVSSAESEGTLGSAKLSHGGAIRWDKGSTEYQTILGWIKGAK